MANLKKTIKKNIKKNIELKKHEDKKKEKVINLLKISELKTAGLKTTKYDCI